MSPLAPGQVDAGFHEAVLLSHDAQRMAAGLQDALGYQLCYQGVATEALARFYGDALAVGGADLVLGAPGQDRGFLRVLQAREGLPPGRRGGQAWDTGGIFDIDVRSLGGIEPLTERAVRSGFVPLAPITDYDFAGLKVREVVMTGPDAVGLALIEQLDPPLQGFEAAEGPASYAFNSTQVVASLDAAKGFFLDALGWKPVYETSWAHPGSGLNCLGLPLNIAREHLLKVGIYQAQGENFGSVELLEVQGLEGMDLRNPRGEVRLGVAALRFPVSDLDGVLARAQHGGGDLVQTADDLEFAPYGRLRAAAVETPWGARLEFYSR